MIDLPPASQLYEESGGELNDKLVDTEEPPSQIYWVVSISLASSIPFELSSSPISILTPPLPQLNPAGSVVAVIS